MSDVFLFWSVIGALLILTVTVLVVPLMQRRQPEPVHTYDLTVYKDQLAAVERDLKYGLLTAELAEGSRIEIQRRILRAAKSIPMRETIGTSTAAKAWLAIVIGVAVSTGAVGLYLRLGVPGLPEQPAAELTAMAQDVGRLVDELARRMEANPKRVEGWVLLARLQRQLGRYTAAARSFRMAVEQGVEDFDTLASYGEMVVMSRGGQVLPEAREAFRRAYRAGPSDPRAAFYLGLAALQEGDSPRAIAIWRGLEAHTSPGTPWLDTLHNHIAAASEQAGLFPSAIAPLPPVSDASP